MSCRSNRREINLVVRVRSFFNLPESGPKSWMQGKTLLTQIVDIHGYGLQHLVDFIVGHYMWGSKQYITFWRELETDSIEIKSDEDMLEWFECNLNKGVAQINAQVNEFVGPLQFSPTKRRCHPSLRNKVYANERGTSESQTNERSPNERVTSTTQKKSHQSQKQRCT